MVKGFSVVIQALYSRALLFCSSQSVLLSIHPSTRHWGTSSNVTFMLSYHMARMGLCAVIQTFAWTNTSLLLLFTTKRIVIYPTMTAALRSFIQLHHYVVVSHFWGFFYRAAGQGVNTNYVYSPHNMLFYLFPLITTVRNFIYYALALLSQLWWGFLSWFRP
jgi:hypothetical protein